MPTPRLTAARYAAVTSTLALVVALGGTSYAAVKIGTKQLKANAVTSAKIKNDAVTGADVKEKTLGVVPNAATAATAVNADTAQRAGEAQVLDGTTIRSVNAAKGTGPGRPLFPFAGAGLKVELTCSGVLPNLTADLVATTTVPGSTIATVVAADNGSAVSEDDVENATFGPGSSFDLLAGDDGDVAQVTFTYGNPDLNTVQGTLLLDVEPLNTDRPCRIWGFVQAH